MSSIIPKTESNDSSSITSKSSSTPAASSYNMHSSTASPTLLPLPDSKASSPGATQSGPDDLATSASPLQRMQPNTNSLQPQSSLPNSPQLPGKGFLMQPITLEHFDKYDNMNTEEVVKKVRELLNRYSITQPVFSDSVLGISGRRFIDILNEAQPWNMLTQRLREHFIRMKIFLEEEDESAVHQLVEAQKKITHERKTFLMERGRFGGTTPKDLTFASGSDKMSPRPMDNNLTAHESRQPVPNNDAIYSSHSQPRTPDPGNNLPIPLTMLTATSTPPWANYSSMTPYIYLPSVYEMEPWATNWDTQIITSQVKETLMTHYIPMEAANPVLRCTRDWPTSAGEKSGPHYDNLLVPDLHSPSRNRSSLSSSDDDVSTLDLSMPSHLRNSVNKDGKCGGNTTNGVDSRSTDDLNSDKESVEDGPTSHHRVPPLRHQEKQAAQNEQSVAPFEGRNYSPISSDSDEIDVIN